MFAICKIYKSVQEEQKAKEGIEGFTLLEMILVITLIGLLTVFVVLPKFTSFSENASESAMNGVVGAVRSGLALYKANLLMQELEPIYPSTLELGSCCFHTILENPVTQGWSTADSITYVYNNNGVNSTFTYSQEFGTFE